jgi:cysteine desulfurase/selenocysteine lyase
LANSNQVYLDTASLGLMTPATITAAQQFTQELGSGQWSKTMLDELVEQARHAMKSFLEIAAGTLSFTPPFGHGLLQIAASLRRPVKALILSDDYPSFQAIWRDTGHPVCFFEKEVDELLDYNRLLSALKDSGAAVLIISHVNYRSGLRVELDILDQICTDNNVLLIVDGTQSVGLVPLSLIKSTGYILLASCYKWLGAGYGLGIRYISSPAQHFLQERGYSTMRNSGSDEALQISHYNFDALVRLKASLSHYQEQDIHAVYHQVQQLARHLVDGMNGDLNRLILPPSHIQSGIVSIVDRPGLFDHLLQHNIRVAQKDGIIRISPHWYNTVEEIELVLEQLNFYQQGRAL